MWQRMTSTKHPSSDGHHCGDWRKYKWKCQCLPLYTAVVIVKANSFICLEVIKLCFSDSCGRCPKAKQQLQLVLSPTEVQCFQSQQVNHILTAYNKFIVFFTSKFILLFILFSSRLKEIFPALSSVYRSSNTGHCPNVTDLHSMNGRRSIQLQPHDFLVNLYWKSKK